MATRQQFTAFDLDADEVCGDPAVLDIVHAQFIARSGGYRRSRLTPGSTPKCLASFLEKFQGIRPEHDRHLGREIKGVTDLTPRSCVATSRRYVVGLEPQSHSISLLRVQSHFRTFPFAAAQSVEYFQRASRSTTTYILHLDFNPHRTRSGGSS
jgi:hypothetical protein